MNNTDIRSLYGLKYNPFLPDVPPEGLFTIPGTEAFALRVQSMATRGGFALITGDLVVTAQYTQAEITDDDQVVESGSILENNADYDGVTVNAGATVNNNASLSNLTNHGTINDGIVSGDSINRGLFNQVEIAPDTILDNGGGTIDGGVNNGSVFGGAIAGSFTNNGILSGKDPDGMQNPDFELDIEVGSTVTGGILKGDIVNKGTLSDVTFGADAAIHFQPWSQSDPGRLTDTIRFIDPSGLVLIINIPLDNIFPDPDSIGEGGLVLSAENLLDYAWDHGWDIEVKTDTLTSRINIPRAISETYFLVGGTVLSEEGAKSTVPFDLIVPYESWEIPEKYTSEDLLVLVWDHEGEGWKETPSAHTDENSLKISTSLISAYAVVLKVDDSKDDDPPTTPADPGDKKSSSGGCFLNTLMNK